MKLAPQSRDILRQYKALMNARRRDAGHPVRQKPGKSRTPMNRYWFR